MPPAQNNPEERFASAVKLHQQGRLPEAEAAYCDLLTADPQHAGALHYFGVLLLQQGRAEAAAVARHRQQICGRNPDNPTMTDLDRWHTFEQTHPRVFLGMYQFWVRSGSSGTRSCDSKSA